MRVTLSVAAMSMVLLAACSGCVDPCGNQVIREVPSPDGRLKAVVFERDCGATTAFSTQVSVMPSGQQLLTGATWLHWTRSGNVFIADANHGEASGGPGGGPNVDVQWTDTTSLRISHDKRARVFLQVPSRDGIAIEVVPE